MSILHFGCRVLHPETARLTRDTYAVIDNAARNNSLYESQYSPKRTQSTLAKREISSKYGISKSLFEDFHCAEVNEIVLKQFIEDDEKEIEAFVEKAFRLLKYKREMKAAIKQYAADSEMNPEEITYVHVLLSIIPSVLLAYWEHIKEHESVLIKQIQLEKEKQTRELKICDEEWDDTFGQNAMREYDIHYLLKKCCKIPFFFYQDYYSTNLPYYSPEFLKKYQQQCLANYDMNMLYFSKLDLQEFNDAIADFMSNHPDFFEVHNLNDYAKTPGIYVMILDDYKQAYIGITRVGLKKRIQKHWTNKKPFDRLIWGTEESSILSIDSFRHLDTTRILFSPHPEFTELETDENGAPVIAYSLFGQQQKIYKNEMFMQSEEYRLIETGIPQKFLLNRTAGGQTSLLDSFLNMKSR